MSTAAEKSGNLREELRDLGSVGLIKEDIRVLSRELGLPTWNKQSFACLASRFPYGTDITPKKLEVIDQDSREQIHRKFSEQSCFLTVSVSQKTVPD